MNILIVDDNETNLYLLESLLTGSGHGVHKAANGAEAVEIIQAGGVDLIISDILMPVMDGFQLCRKVKTDERWRHIPFIIYTATYTGPQDEAFALEIGADRFVQKPCEPETLMGIVNTLMAEAKHPAENRRSTPSDEEEILKLYNERLVRKLEQKMLQAENEIQKRKEIEESLKESEETLRRITSSAQDAIIMMDDLGKISFWNEAAERAFGYSKAEILGRDLHLMLTPVQYQDNYLRRFPEFTQTGRGPAVDRVTELTGRKKDGTQFPIELSLSSVKIHGKWHAIGIVRDITERKRIEAEQKELEKKLQQSQKMEAIGTLAGGIAHDFNNILTAMIGYTELSLLRADQDATLKRYLQEVFSAGKRARDLVNQILAVARETNEEIRPVQIRSIVQEVLKLIRSSIPTTIEVRQNLESDALIMGNATRIHQIVMNLCTNAAQAMQDRGGTLEVDLMDVTIDDPPGSLDFDLATGRYIRLRVSDTGPGISSDIIGSIFEPYFTTKSAGEGTGLGLSVVHGIVESYGGKIRAESELGKGARLTIYLPVTTKSDTNHRHAPKALPQGSERILFLDDEVTIAQMGGQMLSSLGYCVTERTSSVEALELFRSRPNDFDLVITDMTMPNLTGDRLAVELIKIRPDIPIILCTGYSRKLSDKTVSQLGIKALTYKPIAMTELSKLVRKVLDESGGPSQK